MTAKHRDSANGRLVWDSRGPLPFESSWSMFVKLLHWNVLTVTELVSLIKRLGGSLQTGMLARFDGAWVDFETFAAFTGATPSQLKQGFLTELGFPVPGRDWAGVRHCPACIAQGFHSSLFDVVLLDDCPWHGVPLTEPCLKCLDRVSTGPHRQRGRCDHISQLLAPFGVRATATLLPAATASRIATCGQRFVEWWARAGQRDPDRNALIDDYSYAVKDRVDGYELFKLSYLVKKAGQPPIPVRIPTVPCDSMHWLEQPVDSLPKLTDNPEFLRCYKSLRRHLQKRFLGRHRRCLRRMDYFDTAYSPVFLNSCQCRVALFFCAWREAHELIFPPHRPPWTSDTGPRLMEVRRLQPFQDSARSALHFLYADFVRALWQLCSLDPSCSYEIAMFRQPWQRRRLIGFWEGLPRFHESKQGDLLAPFTLVYPQVSGLLEALQNEGCPRQPSFELAQRLPEEMHDNPELRLLAVQVVGDKGQRLVRIYL